MKTVTVQIGNSDDKLTQSQWKDYVNQVHGVISIWGNAIHFSAPSVGWADWQNACWVFDIFDGFIPELKDSLSEIRKANKQDSIAWTEGITVFI